MSRPDWGRCSRSILLNTPAPVYLRWHGVKKEGLNYATARRYIKNSEKCADRNAQNCAKKCAEKSAQTAQKRNEKSQEKSQYSMRA